MDVYHSSDNGQTWEKSSLPIKQPWEKEIGKENVFVSLHSKQEGKPNWLLLTSGPAAGQMGKSLYQSVDNGKSWTMKGDLSQTIDGYVTGITFRNDKEGWIASSQHGNTLLPLYQTQDGGTTWTLPAMAHSADSNPIVYTNTQYGFQFSLPESWKNYSIVNSKWEGLAMDEKSASEKVVETSPLISIRDPLWTAQTPRQDIPIMVFTLSQWNSLQQGAFHIGAAPIGPSELGRNDKYVFALPARYNYAFPPGYEEVDKILNSKPLT